MSFTAINPATEEFVAEFEAHSDADVEREAPTSGGAGTDEVTYAHEERRVALRMAEQETCKEDA